MKRFKTCTGQRADGFWCDLARQCQRYREATDYFWPFYFTPQKVSLACDIHIRKTKGPREK